MRITWWDKEFSSSHLWTNSKNWRWLMTLQKLNMSLRWYHLSKKHNDSYQIYVLKKCEDDLFVYLLFKYYYHENLHCRWFIFQSFIIIYYHPKNFLRHFFEAIQKNDDDFYKRFVTLKRSNIFFHFSWFSNLMIFPY